MKIFVSHASDFLTDNASHGEGLICFSILNGLAERGHEVFAFSQKVDIQRKHQNLYVFSTNLRMPFDSLNPFYFSLYANALFKNMRKRHHFDFVWRMNPFGVYCPIVPYTGELPLVMGPFYYEWKERSLNKSKRFFISLVNLLKPFSLFGFRESLKKSKALFCATESHALKLGKKYEVPNSFDLPLIIEGPEKITQKDFNQLKIIFVGNLLGNKNPLLFCEIVKELKNQGQPVSATLCGDGPMMEDVLSYIKEHKLNCIKVLGRIPNDEVLSLMEEHNILINPSKGEPYGRNNVEAMSRGLVVVCHNSGGPRDFINDSKTGVLVDDLSARAFADRISHLKTDTLREISQNAFKKSKDWSKEKVLSQLENRLLGI